MRSAVCGAVVTLHGRLLRRRSASVGRASCRTSGRCRARRCVTSGCIGHDQAVGSAATRLHAALRAGARFDRWMTSGCIGHTSRRRRGRGVRVAVEERHLRVEDEGLVGVAVAVAMRRAGPVRAASSSLRAACSNSSRTIGSARFVADGDRAEPVAAVGRAVLERVVAGAVEERRRRWRARTGRAARRRSSSSRS